MTSVSLGQLQQVLADLRSRHAPYLLWETVTPASGGPLARVTSGEADYAVVDANEFAYSQHLFPDVVLALKLPDTRGAHWIVPKRARSLLVRVNAFFDELRKSSRLPPLLAAATPDSPDFALQVSQQLQKDIALELPALRPHFEEAARETGVDWRLLAALGYVESKWQTQAASADGAQGVMMLTGETATSLGVTDRNDARQNILAGARYFVKVREQIPDRIQEPDRTWFTLAAYNMGYGHLEDARKLTQTRGKSADVWADVRGALPLGDGVFPAPTGFTVDMRLAYDSLRRLRDVDIAWLADAHYGVLPQPRSLIRQALERDHSDVERLVYPGLRPVGCGDDPPGT